MGEKILDEEIMSDDELDNVAGGSFDELKADAQALQSELPVGIKLSYPSGIGNMRIYDRDAAIGVFNKYGLASSIMESISTIGLTSFKVAVMQ